MQISIDESVVRPTGWDNRAVQEDLREYVSLSRFINGSPTVRIINGKLVAISGLPFVRAAQEANPPLEQIVCHVEGDKESLERLDIKIVKARELLDQYPEHEVYQVAQLLSFTRSLDAEERQAVENDISSFFKEMVNHPEYGGKYRTFGNFTWGKDKNRLAWTWERCDAGGEHGFRLFAMLKRLENKITPIRSLNGITYSFQDYRDDF